MTIDKIVEEFNNTFIDWNSPRHMADGHDMNQLRDWLTKTLKQFEKEVMHDEAVIASQVWGTYVDLALNQQKQDTIDEVIDIYSDLEQSIWDMSTVGKPKINDVIEEANKFKKEINKIKEL